MADVVHYFDAKDRIKIVVPQNQKKMGMSYMNAPNDSISVRELKEGRGKVSEKTENYIHVSTAVSSSSFSSDVAAAAAPKFGKGPGATLGLIVGSAQCWVARCLPIMREIPKMCNKMCNTAGWMRYELTQRIVGLSNMQIIILSKLCDLFSMIL